MTQEEKAKRYDEAIEKFKVILNSDIVKNGEIIFADNVRKIFPELKESEDDIMKKAILSALRGGIDTEKYLEKHGTNYTAVENWLEKQGEQNTTNKVEPKFEIENEKWYVCTQTYVLEGKIVVIEGQTYQAEKDNVIKGEDGCLFIDRHDGKASDYFRHWTIQDAKEGDVLVNESGLLFIYNGYLEEKQWPFAHGGINIYDRFAACDGLLPFTHEKITPATKEQRDLLFQKMKEAGYTWDAEKKELKEIKQKPVTFNDTPIIGPVLNDYCCKQYDALHKENGGVLSFARLQHLAMDIYGWCIEQIEQKPTELSLPCGKNETAEKLIALAECLEMDGDCMFNGLSGYDYEKLLRALAIELIKGNNNE